MARCVAHRSTDGLPCTRWAIRGGATCMSHGGASGRVRAAANRRLAEQKAVKSLAEIGYSAVEDPWAALSDLAGKAVALVAWSEAQVAALGEDTIAVDKLGSEEVKGALKLLERSLDRAGRLVAQCAALNIEDRRVRLEEAQVQVVIRLIGTAMERVSVPASMRAMLWASFKAEVDAESAAAPRTVPAPSRRDRRAIEGPR